MSEQRTIKKVLKSYHCWHTPLDCQGCDKKEVCDKETAQAELAIKEIVLGWIPTEDEINLIIQNKLTDDGINFNLKKVAQAIRQAMIEKVGGG